VPPSFPYQWALMALQAMKGTPARRGPVRCCSHVWVSSPGHGVGCGQQVRRTKIRRHSACPLNTVGGVRLSWPLVMLRRGYTSLLTSGSSVAMPGVVEVRRGPGIGARALAGGMAYLLGSGKAQPTPKG
jgi:hypothetical protein